MLEQLNKGWKLKSNEVSGMLPHLAGKCIVGKGNRRGQSLEWEKVLVRSLMRFWAQILKVFYYASILVWWM